MNCSLGKGMRRMKLFSKIFTHYTKRVQQRNIRISASILSDILSKETFQTFTGEEKIKSSSLAVKKNYLPYAVEEKDIEVVEDLKQGNIIYPYKTPIERATKIMAEDIKVLGREIVYALTNVKLGDLEVKYFPRYTDILIVGNNPIGLAIAYAIRSTAPYGSQVMIVDIDNNPSHVSANLGQGMLLQQDFTETEEIEMSKYCAEFLSTFHRHTDIDNHPQFKVRYDPLGSLVFPNKDNVDITLKKLDTLRQHGVKTAILDYSNLKNMFPWLNIDEDVLFGSLGLGNEGIYDPWTVMMALKCKAFNLGVVFNQAQVIDFGMSNYNVRRVVCKLPDGTYNSIDFAYCILATGMETNTLLKNLHKSTECPINIQFPIEERKRYEYCFQCPNGPGLNTPIIVDSDGTYLRREGVTGHYVAGVPSVPSNDDPENGLHSVFVNKIKPFLLKWVPQYKEFNLVSGWIDTYDYNTANEVGIIGPHPEFCNVIFATGFAHKGIQYAPAVGRAIMEYIYYDNYVNINFEKFHIENMYRKQHLEAERREKEKLEAGERIRIG